MLRNMQFVKLIKQIMQFFPCNFKKITQNIGNASTKNMHLYSSNLSFLLSH